MTSSVKCFSQNTICFYLPAASSNTSMARSPLLSTETRGPPPERLFSKYRDSSSSSTASGSASTSTVLSSRLPTGILIKYTNIRSGLSLLKRFKRAPTLCLHLNVKHRAWLLQMMPLSQTFAWNKQMLLEDVLLLYVSYQCKLNIFQFFDCLSTFSRTKTSPVSTEQQFLGYKK